MKLMIIGATRGTGLHLAEQALNAGHEVTVLVRDATRLTLRHPRLTVAIGDATNAASMVPHLNDIDVVLSAVGAPPSDRSQVRARSAEAVIDAMRSAGIERLVCLSGLGLDDTRPLLPWFFKWVVVPLYLRHVFADHAIQEANVAQSGLRWTLVRPANLTNGPATGDYRSGFGGDATGLTLKISRADTAAFMLQAANDDGLVGQRPALSY